ncbi:MAG: MFS transporter, partial [Aquabacterium sp.]
TVVASMLGHRLSARIGPGPAMVVGFLVCGFGWLQLLLAPVGTIGVLSFAFMLMLYSAGAVFVFVNFLALRQAVTPAPMLGRMTATMRWLTLLPAAPGALIGGWLGEHVSLRSALALAGCGAMLLAFAVWRWSGIRQVRVLPRPVGAEGSASVATHQPTPTGAAAS